MASSNLAITTLGKTKRESKLKKSLVPIDVEAHSVVSRLESNMVNFIIKRVEQLGVKSCEEVIEYMKYLSAKEDNDEEEKIYMVLVEETPEQQQGNSLTIHYRYDFRAKKNLHMEL